MTILTASEAQQIRLAKRSVSHDTYKILFNTAIQRIKIRAEMNETTMLFKIPHYILGRPTINVKHAARYIAEKLRIYGYKAQYQEREGTYFVEADWGITPVRVDKKPKDVRRPTKTTNDIRVDPNEAVRRLELIKSALKNSMKK